MSDRKGKGYYPSEPSGSGQSSSSHSKRVPYARSSSEHDRGHSSKGVVKTVSHRKYDDSGSSSSHSKPYASERMEIETFGSESKDAPKTRVRSRAFKDIVFVTKPSNLVSKKGISGEKITLQTNYFKLLTTPNWCLYKYRVDFEPEEERTVVRKGLLRVHQKKIDPYIFDGTVLYTSTRLPDKLEFVSDKICDDNMQVKINIKLVGDMAPTDPHYIDFFNKIMRKCLEHLRLQLIGRNYFDTQSKVKLNDPFKLELWPGYITSIRQHERNILMCTEITHKVMHRSTLYDVLAKCHQDFGADFKGEFCKTAIGQVVLTDYNNNTYRIEDVDFEVTPCSTFTRRGQAISYQDYYQTRYNIAIQCLTQPMLVTRSKPKIRNAGQGDLVYLVPELCRSCGLNDQMKDNFRLMRELATHTRVSPQSRIEKLMSFNRRLRQESNIIKQLSDWNMELDRSLVEIPARILPPERLIVRGNNINSNRGDWTTDMRDKKLLNSKELRNWVVIATQRDKHNVQHFLHLLSQVSHKVSFHVEQPYVHLIHDDKANTYAETLEFLFTKSTPDLMFCVVSNNRIDRYTAIKKKCCIDRPVPSQVILQKNIQNKNLTIATKVAIQMNCKLGGAPWTIDIPSNLKSLMAIGFDNCRGANTKGKDFLAMVATIDTSLTNYYSIVTAYHSDEELVEQISSSVCKALQAYRQHNRALPMHIIIYRDGISDGQVRSVFENEVGHLKKKLEEAYYGPNFKLTFIVVSKRINTRFFRNKGNPDVGTVIDDVVTSPFKYDFFIVSQQVRQGTVAPTAYNVISDNSGLEPEIIQQVTYKLTHMYYNCTTTVRVPAQCHYAQKLSTLAGRVLYRPPQSGLENKLFFL